MRRRNRRRKKECGWVDEDTSKDSKDKRVKEGRKIPEDGGKTKKAKNMNRTKKRCKRNSLNEARQDIKEVGKIKREMMEHRTRSSRRRPIGKRNIWRKKML